VYIKHGAKVVETKRCSVDGCTNIVVGGGFCVRHGAKVKRCSFGGCTNHSRRGGVYTRHGAKVKQCSFEGCMNAVIKGGVCKRHGAKVKLCSVEGCTNQSQRRGLCRRHGAYRNPTDESTALASCFGSDFDKTTLNHSNQRTPSASHSQGNVPAEVAICVVIANSRSNHVEV
jgi:hypothetical protein